MKMDISVSDKKSLPEQLIEKFEYKKNVFNLGCTAKKLTIHSQQRRAFNLVWALNQRHESKERIGIIGGGIAGITVAAAFLTAGWEVVIFERNEQLMHLQEGCLTRYIHPNIADWPNDGYGYPLTDLPYLNWKAGTTSQVIEYLQYQWKRIENEYLNKELAVKKPVDVTKINDGESPSIVTAGGTEAFKYIILAVGYGVEELTKSDYPSYWRNDDLAQPNIETEGGRKQFAVYGAGDGGLIDVLRLKLLNFQHHSFVRNSIYRDWIKEAGKKFNPDDPQEFWKKFPKEEVVRWAEDLGPIRKDVSLRLITREKTFHSNAQKLHQVCVSLLHQVDQENLKLEIKEFDQFKTDTDELLVERIGPKSAMGQLYSLDDEDVKKLKEKWGEFDSQPPHTFDNHYGVDFLADEFGAIEGVDAYEIGIVLGDKKDSQSKMSQILKKCGFDITEKIIESIEKKEYTWRHGKRVTSLRIEENVQLVTFSGADKSSDAGAMSHRSYIPRGFKCLIFRTNSKGVVNKLLDGDSICYHLYRIFLNEKFDVPLAHMDNFINTDTHVFLINLRKVSNSIEVHCTEGMYQCHNLFSIPVLVQIFANSWRLTDLHGYGWAARNTLLTNRVQQRGNELVGMS